MLRTAHRQSRTYLASALVVLACTAPALAQQRQLTIDDLFDPERRQDFQGTAPTNLKWLNDMEYVSPRRGKTPEETVLLRVEAATGTSRPFLDRARLETAFRAVPGIHADDVARLSRLTSYITTADANTVLLSMADDLFVYKVDADRVVRLTNSPGREEEASFSPDGRLVAFVRDSNLFVVDVDHRREVQLTTDGAPKILNGKLDWVYQEEIYGRGSFQAYWWSPDSTRLAFLQLNGEQVPEFTVLDHIPYHLDVETYGYPKAGDPNPVARLALVSAVGGQPSWIDTSKYTSREFLIVNVNWSPDSQQVAYSVQDREQTWLDLNVADVKSRSTTTLFRETSKAWVNELGGPAWLKDGSFLWFSERTGWKHLYHYKSDGSLIHEVTKGPWEARTFYGVDEASGWVYFAGTERSHIGQDVYRVKLDGTSLTRLSQSAGTHSATFNPSFTRYLGTWSDVSTPPQVRLHRADGNEERVVDATPVTALASYRLGKPEFLQVKTRDGFTMEALMIKPPDFNPARRYPVYQHTYAGPHAPHVRNAWGGTTNMYHQLLAQRGIIVWICDNRTASGKGAESAWPAYKNFGELELRDIEDGVTWLKQQPYVDATRIGINGWSFGGFMVSYALTHSKSFVMGIAGGSVTDWRDYDSIYTERYMMMPQNNPEGYEKTAPRAAAKDLSGSLMLVHGLMDDNVHWQNTVQFMYELQKAGKPFELMVYPKSRHGVTDPLLNKHLRSMMLDFVMRQLKPVGATTTTQTAQN